MFRRVPATLFMATFCLLGDAGHSGRRALIFRQYQHCAALHALQQRTMAGARSPLCGRNTASSGRIAPGDLCAASWRSTRVLTSHASRACLAVNVLKGGGWRAFGGQRFSWRRRATLRGGRVALANAAGGGDICIRDWLSMSEGIRRNGNQWHRRQHGVADVR